MSVPKMGTLILAIETTSCENQTKELSTLFTSFVDPKVGDDGFVKPSLHFNFSMASPVAHN